VIWPLKSRRRERDNHPEDRISCSVRLPGGSFGEIFDPVRIPTHTTSLASPAPVVQTDPAVKEEPVASVVPAESIDVDPGESASAPSRESPSHSAKDDLFVGYENELPRAAIAGLGKSVSLLATPASARRAFCPINLGAHMNRKLGEPFPGADVGNDLSELPPGPQLLAGIPFVVGSGLIYVGRTLVAGPQQVAGITIGGHFGKLHVLHSCGFGHGTQDGRPIARYVVSYEDGSTVDLEVVYGRDLLDWWSSPGRQNPSRASVGWEGENAAVRGSGVKVQLFVASWDNPQSGKRVLSLDYVAADATTEVVPFCVAITAER
jgi:hypothetical protein